MPNGRRRRFSVKQDLVLKDPKTLQNASNSSNSNDRKLRVNLQNNKAKKFNNKFFPTGSKEPPELESVIELESSEAIIVKPLAIDKDVMATSSNIDFFNILNISNGYQSKKQKEQWQETNQIGATDSKESRSVPRRDKYPRQHRVKVRSPKRRSLITEEVLTDYDMKITESLDAIDWEQELEETEMMNVQTNVNEERQLTNQDNPTHHSEPICQDNNTNQGSPVSQDNPAAQDSPNNQRNVASEGDLSNQGDPTNQGSPTNQGNNQKKQDSILICYPNNRSTSPANTIIQSYPVYMPSVLNQSSPINQSNVINPSNLSNQNHPSNNSFDAMCRICHGGESLSAESGMMISACGCRGTVGRVHVKCLERWLTESGKSRCELCGTRYATRRVHKYGFPKALAIWVLSQNAKQLMVDSLGIMLMSPLAVVAAWLSGRTLAGLMTPESQQTPWPLASTFVLACMTLVCYYCWILSAVTRHALSWWIWYRSQYEVRLQLQENED